jgi:hypothetical protein
VRGEFFLNALQTVDVEMRGPCYACVGRRRICNLDFLAEVN